MDDDDRRSNVAGAESGTDASPAPEPREMTGRESDLAAKSLRARDPHNEPAVPSTDGEKDDDVDRRP
ncbi:hypothetical protein [Longimicrobium sp.]|uniref:hypothetical protein n=1 Tax=Longimicrobium sp. TaxID=2029185 RepID=UPI002C06AEC9|nr:hypothetical protein [Longimicrobium sp.]HSU14915.1 hypothetical protein [Longimicrobium sp.]